MSNRIHDRMLKAALAATILLSLTACETVQTTQGGVVGVERQQKMIVSSAEIEQASRQQYAALIAQEVRKVNSTAIPRS